MLKTILAAAVVVLMGGPLLADGWYPPGSRCWTEPGVHRFEWPVGVTAGTRLVCGSGGSGGGGIGPQFGGGGGGGAKVVDRASRPQSGTSWIKIHPGGREVNAGVVDYGKSGGSGQPQNLVFQGEVDGTQFDDLVCFGGPHGTQGGQGAESANQGADGGTPGVCQRSLSGELVDWRPGSMGEASSPAIGGVTTTMAAGGASPCGGMPGNNTQSSANEGGGGGGNGDQTHRLPYQQLPVNVILYTGGSGYAAGDKLRLPPEGSGSPPVIVTVTGVNNAGGIVSHRIEDPGFYHNVPPNPLSVVSGTTVSGTPTAGSGATFGIDWRWSLNGDSGRGGPGRVCFFPDPPR